MRPDAAPNLEADVLVIGSGAGGAVTAATLSEAGLDVLVLEEGPALDASKTATHTPQTMLHYYRNAGLTPIHGRQSIAFVEGCCTGGSTEVNSTFWHRPPAVSVARWQADYRVRDLTEADLEAAFVDLEADLQVRVSGAANLPPSSEVFRRGLVAVGAPALETSRTQRGDLLASQFEPGARSSMSQTYLPRAMAAGARLLTQARVERLHRSGRRVQRVSVVQDTPEGRRRFDVSAGTVFVCGGAIQTPALLRRSGIRRAIGNSLRIQPMLKVVAEYDELIDGHRSVMPVYQMRDPDSQVFLGGSVFTPGFLGLTLTARWPENQPALRSWRRMALYYTSCRGSGRGSVRAMPFTGEAFVRYSISGEDQRHLSQGVARLSEVLFAGGARRVFPGLQDWPPLESIDDARALSSQTIPIARMSLSTVHVSSSCPMGEDEKRCPVDSYGSLRGLENLRLSDASIIPDAPGVNPQGTVMALALRNARRFVEEKAGARSTS